jgi:signal transduction histidine kinase
MRNRISHDLHDDVGSTLGSISIYSEVAKATGNEDREMVLDKIGDASREMMDKLNDIVWSINPENDSMEKIETRM